MRIVQLPNGDEMTDVPENMNDAEVYQIALDNGLFRPKHDLHRELYAEEQERIQSEQAAAQRKQEINPFTRDVLSPEERENEIDRGKAITKGLSYGMSVPFLGDPENTTENDLYTLGSAAVSPLGMIGRRPGAFLANQVGKVFPKFAGTTANKAIALPGLARTTGNKYLSGALGEGLTGLAAGYGLSSGDDRLSRGLEAGAASLFANPLLSGLGAGIQHGYHLAKPSAKFALDKMLKLGKTSSDELTSAGAKTLAEISPVSRAGISGTVAGNPHVAKSMRAKLAKRSANVSEDFDSTMQSNVGKIQQQEQKYLKELSDVKSTSKEHYSFLEGKQSSLPENQISRELSGVKGLKNIMDEAAFELKQSGINVTSVRDLPFLQKISSQLTALAKGKSTGKTLAYRQAQRKIDDIITKDASNYPKASKGWALKSEMERARELGSRFVSAKPSSVTKYLKDKPREVKAAYKAGALESIDDVLDPAARVPDRFKKRPFEKKLGLIMPKRQVERFYTGLNKKIEFDKTATQVGGSLESGIMEAGGEAIKPRVPSTPNEFTYKAFNIARKMNEKEAGIAAEAFLSPGMDVHGLLRGYDPYPNIPAGSIGGSIGGLLGNY